MSLETNHPVQTEPLPPLDLDEVRESFETIGTSQSTMLYVQRTLASAESSGLSETDTYTLEGLQTVVGGLRRWLTDHSFADSIAAKPPLRKSYAKLAVMVPDITVGDIDRGVEHPLQTSDPVDTASYTRNNELIKELRPRAENQAASAEAYDDMASITQSSRERLSGLPPTLNPKQIDLLQRILASRETDIMRELSQKPMKNARYRELSVQLVENSTALQWTRTLLPEVVAGVEPQEDMRAERPSSASDLTKAVLAPVIGVMVAARLLKK